MGQSYCNNAGKYLRPHEVSITDDGYIEVATSKPVVATWEKMSKSKFNGVDPTEMFKEYSTDTVRLLMLADVAPTSHRHWSKDSKLINFCLYTNEFPKITFSYFKIIKKNCSISRRAQLAEPSLANTKRLHFSASISHTSRLRNQFEGRQIHQGERQDVRQPQLLCAWSYLQHHWLSAVERGHLEDARPYQRHPQGVKTLHRPQSRVRACTSLPNNHACALRAAFRLGIVGWILFCSA